MSEIEPTEREKENTNLAQSVKLKNEIDQLKRKQLQIMELKMRSQTDHHQEMIALRQQKLVKISAQKKGLDHDILTRTAQLDVLKHELHRRDQHHLHNLDHLLSSARLQLLNDAEYYKTRADKLALVQPNINAEERKNILIQQRRTQLDREQCSLTEALQKLQNDKNEIEQKLKSLRGSVVVDDEKAESELRGSVSVAVEDDMVSIRKNICKLKNELSASEERYESEQKKDSILQIPTRYNQTILAEKQARIAAETLALDKEANLLLRKQKQHQLNAVCSEVIGIQLIETQITSTISAIFDDFKDLYGYTQQMTNDVLLSSVVGLGDSNAALYEVSKKCLQQLQRERDRRARPRFTQRHLSITPSNDHINSHGDKRILTEKKKLYERFASDDINVFFCFESYSPFVLEDWLQKEQTFWQQHMDLNRLSEIETLSHKHSHYSHLISSARFVVCGTDSGHIVMYNIALKCVVATTVDDTRNSRKNNIKTAAAIKMMQISDNNQQIVCLQENGIAVAYNVQHNRIQKHSQIEYQQKVTYVAFHSHLLINGEHTSVMLGLENGSLIKWNFENARNTHILFGNRIHNDAKQWEQFEGHSAEICFIGFIDKMSDIMITVDRIGMVCVWHYHRSCLTTYGWFAPKHRFCIDCDSFVKNMISGDKDTQILYNVNSSVHEQDGTQYESHIKRDVLSKTHVCCQYQRSSNDQNKLYFMPEATNLDCRYRAQSDTFTMDILAYSSSNRKLVCHYQQKYIQKRFRGEILSAKFCSNYRDIIVAIGLMNQNKALEIVQFRLLRYDGPLNIDEADDTATKVSVDPHFMVNIKQTNVDDWPVYAVSPVMVPPCSDYLYVLIGNSLSIYSIYTSQKVYSLSVDSNLCRNNQFCVTKDHQCVVFARTQVLQRRSNDYCLAFHKIVHHNQTTAMSAWRTELRKSDDHARVTRTPWRWRSQRRCFAAYNGDHETHIKQIIHNIVERIFS